MNKINKQELIELFEKAMKENGLSLNDIISEDTYTYIPEENMENLVQVFDVLDSYKETNFNFFFDLEKNEIRCGIKLINGEYKQLVLMEFNEISVFDTIEDIIDFFIEIQNKCEKLKNIN